MRKILGLTFLLSVFSVSSYAVEPVWLSSHTESADTTQNLCKGINFLIGTSTSTFGGHGNFHGVCIDSGTAAASSFTVYNSSGAASNTVANIDATKVGCYYYDVAVSSGLTYSNSSVARVTILFQCY